MTSFTTSLNLLFFYMTWATVVLSHKPLFIEFWGTLVVRVIFYIAPCSLFLLFDTLLPGVSASIKAYSTRALPLGGAVRRGSRVNASTRRRRLLFIVGVSVLNTFLGILAQAGTELAYTMLLSSSENFILPYRQQQQRGWWWSQSSSSSSFVTLLTGAFRPKKPQHAAAAATTLLHITTTLPLPWTILRDLARLYIARAVLSYYAHRFLLHNSGVSPTVTRLHAAWQHQLRLTIPFAAAYDHPVAYLLHTWLPLFLPSAAFRVHFLTFLLFTALVSVEEALAWSGYMVLPLGVLLSGAARRTEKHLLSGGEGNFAPYGLLDWLHGTGLAGRDVLDDVREEMHRRDLRGKVKRAARQAGEKLWSSSSSSSSSNGEDDDLPEGNEESDVVIDDDEDDGYDDDEYRSRRTAVQRRAKPKRREQQQQESHTEDDAAAPEEDRSKTRRRPKAAANATKKTRKGEGETVNNQATSGRQLVKKVLKNATRRVQS